MALLERKSAFKLGSNLNAGNYISYNCLFLALEKLPDLRATSFVQASVSRVGGCQ